jgi:hypothetical protein
MLSGTEIRKSRATKGWMDVLEVGDGGKPDKLLRVRQAE